MNSTQIQKKFVVIKMIVARIFGIFTFKIALSIFVKDSLREAGGDLEGIFSLLFVKNVKIVSQ